MILIFIISIICNILVVLLLVRAALSWVVYFVSRNNAVISRIYRITVKLTEPLVRPVRNFISRFIRTGPIDFAPLALFLIIIIISQILTRILAELLR